VLSAAVADIFQRQTKARIMVGDPHQQIYAFRGAINAMELVQATRTFFLTQVLDCAFIQYIHCGMQNCTSRWSTWTSTRNAVYIRVEVIPRHHSSKPAVTD